MSYGSYLDFSSVSLPGVGGGINASNAISTDDLAKMNKEGKKWAPDISGGMSHHNEAVLDMHKKAREKKEGMVNRSYNEFADGPDAMKEIFARKKARSASFKEMKRNEYGFSEGDSQDSEMLSMPLPSMGMSEKCKCGGTCALCQDKKRKDIEFREWSTEKRKQLEEGKVSGEFAGPGMSFPISSPEDVAAAWSSVGRAKGDPRKVMHNIIKIAKKNNWTAGLPDSVKKRLEAGESGLPG
jgi:hypothetical protein